MAFMRIGWLILLLLTVMTPLARAQCAVVPEDPAEASLPVDPPTPDPSSEDDSEQETLLQLPAPDVWDGNASRCPVGVSGSALVASLLGYDVGVRLQPQPAFHIQWLDVVRLAGRAQRAWMACRYAHAPPLA